MANYNVVLFFPEFRTYHVEADSLDEATNNAVLNQDHPYSVELESVEVESVELVGEEIDG